MPNRQLLLLRHAKAVIGEAGMEDFDRPLAERGRKAAGVMGRYLAEHDLVPDLALCSPARRTRETWEIAARELPGSDVRDSVARIRTLNALEGRSIQAGQSLAIPAS